MRLVGVTSAVIAVVLIASFYTAANVGLGPKDSSALPEGPTTEVAFVANSVDGTVTLVDLQRRQAVGNINIIPDGAAVGFFRDPLQWLGQSRVESRGGLNYVQDTDVSRDGSVLFVSRGHLADVAALTIPDGELLWRTPISGFRADHMTLSPDGKRLYVAALIYGDNVIEVLDAASGRKLDAFEGGHWPHDVHTSPDGSRIYTASLGDMSVDVSERSIDEDAYIISINDSDTLERVAHMRFSSGIRPFAITADESTVYAQVSNWHGVLAAKVPDVASAVRLELPVAEGITEADWDFEAPHHGLALSPDEQTLCLAGRASDYAALVRTADLSLITTIAVGDAPSWAAITQSGELCVLANTRSDDVSLVSMTEQREIARIKTGRAPKHATIAHIPVGLLQEP